MGNTANLFYHQPMNQYYLKDVDALTNFDPKQCHRWAQLLLLRQQKLKQALAAIEDEDFDLAKRLSSEIFSGVNGKLADPGMSGSLLYHMAMVTKMEAETSVLLNELQLCLPDVSLKLESIYSDFQADAKELTGEITPFTLSAQEIASSTHLENTDKINLFNKLKKERKNVEEPLTNKDPKASEALEKLFLAWTEQIIRMRLIQEYETIKGLLVTAKLAEDLGVQAVEDAMERVQDRFGQETVEIALDVTLKSRDAKGKAAVNHAKRPLDQLHDEH